MHRTLLIIQMGITPTGSALSNQNSLVLRICAVNDQLIIYISPLTDCRINSIMVKETHISMDAGPYQVEDGYVVIVNYHDLPPPSYPVHSVFYHTTLGWTALPFCD